MGKMKQGASDVFNAAMQGLLATPGVTQEMVYETARPLIQNLLKLRWDAYGTAVMYDDNPAIVRAFKDNGVLLPCEAEHPGDGGLCKDPERGHDGPHEDYWGNTWT